MSAPVLIMAGGTGGHIFPGLAVARALAALDVPVIWLGAAGAMETRLVPSAGIELHTLAIGGIRGKSLLTRLLAPLRLLRAVFSAWRLLGRLRPRAVIGFGGYAAGPGGLAAWLRRLPLLVHEQNSVAGYTNRVLARRARRVLSGFPDVLPRAEWVGTPVRDEIAALPEPAERWLSRSGPVRLLVLGGSLGAKALNEALPAAMAALPPEKRPRVLHQCGRGHEQATADAYAKLGVEADVQAFLDDMAQVYAQADLVLCRAGALTIAELAAAGVGAILVPFPHAVDDHQTGNARFLVERKAAQLMPQTELSAPRLAEVLADLIEDRSRLLAMAEAARRCARADAAAVVARICLEEAA